MAKSDRFLMKTKPPYTMKDVSKLKTEFKPEPKSGDYFVNNPF